MIKLLDHGFVRLVDSMGGDLSIIRNARVSYDADWRAGELARSVLPVGIYSHMFATVNFRNLFRFLAERLHPHAQYEIRVYAEAMLELIEPIVPVAVAAFKKQYQTEGY